MTEVQRSYVDQEILSDVDDNDSLAETLPDDAETSSEQVTRQTGQQSTEPSRSSLAVQTAKAIEAAEDRTPLPASNVRNVNVDGAHQPAMQASREHEETPLLDAGPAPPDYAAATAWRREQPRGANHGSPSAAQPASGNASDGHVQPEAQPQPHRYQQYRDDIEQSFRTTRTRIERYQDDIERARSSDPSPHHDSEQDNHKDNKSTFHWILTTFFRLVYEILRLAYQTLRYCLPKIAKAVSAALKWCFETRIRAIVTIVVIALVILLPVVFDNQS